MSKLILKHGNGVNFPKSGDYVNLLIVIKTKNNEIIFDSSKIKNHCVRIGKSGCLLLPQIEELIYEMSLYEKCSIEFTKEMLKEEEEIFNEDFCQKLKIYEKIIFEIEIIGISKSRNY